MTNYPYFKSGADGDGNSMIDLSETDVCDTCHSPSGSYDGVNDVDLGAKYGKDGDFPKENSTDKLFVNRV